MTYLLAMVTGGMLIAALLTDYPATARLLVMLALFPGWLTWASWRTERIKRERGEG